MARPLRIDRAGLWQHVTARGNEKRAIFRHGRDYEHFCELLVQAVALYRWRLHAFVLMPNHYHLVVETTEANLSASLHWLNVSYTVWFNRRYDRSGHLLQGRFKAVVVEPERWGVVLSQYVHLNPVRIGRLGLGKAARQADRAGLGARPDPKLVQKRLAVLRSFAWSSYRAYAGYVPAPPWLACEWLLARVGPGTAARRRAAYRRQTEAAVRQGLPPSPWEELQAQCVLGGAEFVAQVRKWLRGTGREQPALRQLQARPTWAAIVRVVEKHKGVPWAEFCEARGDWGRELALYLGRRQGGLKWAELGQLAGGMDYAAAVMAVRRFTKRLRADKALARLVQRAEQEVTNVTD